tara:strand:- start:69 stop:671 length:603 start_codon:yes stop_codon:yes gene_type:complete
MPSDGVSSWQHVLREFVRSERPTFPDPELSALLEGVTRARNSFDRYKKADRSGYSYTQQKATLRMIAGYSRSLADSLNGADLMVQDDLSDQLGANDFIERMIGNLSRLEKACKGFDLGQSEGRPINRVQYQWVIRMADIFESAFAPAKASYSKNGKFRRFLGYCAPDELPQYGTLSSRTIGRILEYRNCLNDRLRQSTSL